MRSPNLLKLALDDWKHGGFGLYIHWPFCQAKCPYCDFNSHVTNTVDHDQWLAAFTAEITRYAAETGPRVLSSIFFGGGTPSLMSPQVIEAVICTAQSAWSFANDIEITLEANPTSIEAAKFSDFRSAGINRASVGVQSLRDKDLKELGRRHSAREALNAIEIARNTFDRVSFDLIYARANQSSEEWSVELDEALSLAPNHLSLYQLTIEPNTAFGARFAAGKLKGLPGEDLGGDLYAETIAKCADAGLPLYEISNHAAPGEESRHNLVYWRNGDFVGIGPGAHGRITIGNNRFATEAIRQPAEWLSAAKLGKTESVRTVVLPHEQVDEMVMMGLRLAEGIDLTRHRSLSGKDFSPQVVSELVEYGLISTATNRIVATDRGKAVLNSVLVKLLAE
jgi:putative oxygen-independent coproporphyrinogen III oxidase